MKTHSDENVFASERAKEYEIPKTFFHQSGYSERLNIQKPVQKIRI